MRASFVALLVALVVGASLPFATHADATPGALATPTAQESGDGSRIVEWQGASAFRLRGICEPTVCLGPSDAEDGRFFLATNGQDGVVRVWWDAANDSLRELRVSVGGITLTGESPLTFEIAGSQAGEYSVHAEPSRFVLGAYDQPVRWTASFREIDAPLHVERSGSASYATLTGCALVVCDSTLDTSSDPLVAPWSARGMLRADWDPKAGPLTLSIPGTTLATTGAPPLALAVHDLPAGEWRVDVRPPTAARPLSSQTVRGSAELTSS